MLPRKTYLAKKVRRTSTLSPAHTPRPHWRKKLLMVLLMGACVGNLHAQWIVEDPAAISKMAGEYVETAKRWKDQYDHYQQQLIKLKRLNFMASRFINQFPERDANYGMEAACPSGEGFPTSFQDALRQVLPDPKGDPVKEQHKICQRIVLMENAKYNETVGVMKTLVQRQQEFDQIESQRAGSGTSEGKLAANDNEVRRFMARATMDVEFWQARMTAYDTYIAALKQDKDRMGQCAMRGCGNGWKKLIGTVVQAAALKVALSAD